MTDWIATFSNSRDSTLVLAGACAILAVGGIEAFRLWSMRATRLDTAARIGTLAVLMAVALIGIFTIGGPAGAASGNHTLALLGVVAVVALAGLRTRKDGEDAERRRIVARDL